ncbi:vitamin B12 dependent-methionine synthase activation domain-containing protein [Konateibacter massiliensis]|uniref:vitamin B12 dependent-methionine synthase activation domain-containing protein n=1 Tax=Konateibacter massiliensis TaxID=2002841 RepID=UPI0015D4F4F9|nr:vitamin B12 dependent-methionine synthase activation domain-containing protein [Konateibacter massiliensis]
MEVNKKETLRYLGYRGQEMDANLEALIDETSQELLNSIAPKSVHQEFSCSTEGDDVVHLGPLVIKSKHLAKNLKGCEYAVIFAATIGSSADTLIKRYSLTNLAKASVVQAAGAALIETFCDSLEDTIRENAAARELYLRPRFSPGYGDLPLELQRDIFRILECSKRIGLSLTDTCLMFPSKSVTAIIGLSPLQNNCHREKCTDCNNTECDYRTN